ncbi:MAG: GxxExxY protein [Calditrichaeota bacterium]|nr:MAG: GxxExxY protein [Calditrichota bacterium]MBL1206505.1 GxxExxY protein [Calditrichota bacterium]NOG46332.1 GxxExxY protein [Calditrichota bacterium]
MTRDELNKLSNKIIELAIKVHKTLGPGFLESVYQEALAYELSKSNIAFEKEKGLPVAYEDIKLDIGFRCDFLVEENIIIETKAVKKITEIDSAQLINYLKVTNLKPALLFNFNVKLLKDGMHRFVNNF